VADLNRQKAKPGRVGRREKVQQALNLRAAGGSYSAIAETMGLKGKQARVRAYELVMEGLADLEARVKESAARTRAIELLRCDTLMLKLWPSASNPRVTDSILRVMERRAKLLGLDAPQKVAQTTPDGEALPPALDLSKLTDEQLAGLDAIYAAGAPQPSTILEEV